MYTEKAQEFINCGAVCSDRQLWNFIKNCRKRFAEITKVESGHPPLNVGALDPVDRAIYDVFCEGVFNKKKIVRHQHRKTQLVSI